MVGEIKNKLGFAQGVIDGVSFSSPCLITDPQDKISFVNQHLLDLIKKPGKPGQQSRIVGGHETLGPGRW